MKLSLFKNLRLHQPSLHRSILLPSDDSTEQCTSINAHRTVHAQQCMMSDSTILPGLCTYNWITLLLLKSQRSIEIMPATSSSNKPQEWSSQRTTIIIASLFLGGFMSLSWLYTWFFEGSPFSSETLRTPFPGIKALLLDIGISHFFIYIWIAYKEPALISRIVWLVSLITFGNIATCIFVIIQCLKHPRDPLSSLLLSSSDYRNLQKSKE
ncbi:hypothetical protein PROFUN_08341 [Planoprotostelium fungivorum]|uniref:DUF1475 domain-containing protein n=1 Tax=Planoprotostelium fungivorum TaxID=1890364 RepID=A0A2P6NI32_9EUKA|nr:hypothetical protein PROFUN_08341 [Planoprotostelium fungivorum]